MNPDYLHELFINEAKPAVEHHNKTSVNNQDKTFTKNGSYTADAGFTGLGNVTVDVPTPEPVIQALEVTENKTYTAPEGIDGYSPVIVNVPTTGGGSIAVSPKEVNFYDYDGTLLHAYTVAEAQTMTELPALPEQPGLICQGWNWSLDDIKAHNRALNIGATYITDDGTTRIYIHLEEGRTSPMLSVCPNGTVTVNWGDGTEPDVLTGTSTSSAVWTPNHEYASPGDYVIRLTVDGSMSFIGATGSNHGSGLLRYTSGGSNINYAYRNAVRKIEIGEGVSHAGSYAFYSCYNLASITIPDSVTSIGTNAFYNCCNLASITIPDSVTSIPFYAFDTCYSLASITIPDSITSIGNYVFNNCYSLASITIPDSITSIGTYAFYNCYGLASITIPDSITSIGNNAFNKCYSLTSITIPDSITSIGNYVFNNCYSLASITIPDSVTYISVQLFYYCFSVRFYDFTKHTAVPTLSNTNAFDGIAADCEIRVPAALYDEWIAATNWATYESQIVAV